MAIRMSEKTWLIWVTLISAVLALVVTALSCSSPSPSSKAPDFTLPTLTGANITLSELQGTPVVLNFWATWCGPCRGELPYFEDVAQQKIGEINVIAVNVGESASTVQAFFGDYEPVMVVALDQSTGVFTDYCQNYINPRGSIPFTLFIDSEGLVRYKRIGAFSSEAALWDTLHSVFGITIP
jgi:thiol-disulfide isomerase/thioredoxin